MNDEFDFHTALVTARVNNNRHRCCWPAGHRWRFRFCWSKRRGGNYVCRQRDGERQETGLTLGLICADMMMQRIYEVYFIIYCPCFVSFDAKLPWAAIQLSCLLKEKTYFFCLGCLKLSVFCKANTFIIFTDSWYTTVLMVARSCYLCITID